MVILVSPSLVCLNFLESFSLSSVRLNFYGIVIIVFSCVWTWLEFAVPVDRIFRLRSKLPCLFPFLFYFLVDFVRFFLVDPVTFLLLFCLCYYNSSAIDSCCKGLGFGCFFSLDLSHL